MSTTVPLLGFDERCEAALRVHADTDCTCGAEYQPSVEERLQHAEAELQRLREQLQRERDASVYAVTNAIAWRDGLERVAQHMDKVWHESGIAYEPSLWAETGGLKGG
jgi:hypothetical protein